MTPDEVRDALLTAAADYTDGLTPAKEAAALHEMLYATLTSVTDLLSLDDEQLTAFLQGLDHKAFKPCVRQILADERSSYVGFDDEDPADDEDEAEEGMGWDGAEDE
jgi:hypothetical protein